MQRSAHTHHKRPVCMHGIGQRRKIGRHVETWHAAALHPSQVGEPKLTSLVVRDQCLQKARSKMGH